jgi:hypothetical protein
VSANKHTSRWHLRGLLFILGSVLLGVGLIFAAAAAKGVSPLGPPEGEATGLWVLGVVLAPFVFIGMLAGVASRFGATTAWWTWLAGLASVGALYALGYASYLSSVREHAWTGASFALGFAVCGAVPVSLVGSLVGLAIGLALAKRQARSLAADEEDIRDR